MPTRWLCDGFEAVGDTPSGAAIDQEAQSVDPNGVELVLGDDGMGIGEAGADVFGLEIGESSRIASAVSPCAKRLRISSTEMRMPRMIGLPPKIFGLAVSRLSKASSCMSFLNTGPGRHAIIA